MFRIFVFYLLQENEKTFPNGWIKTGDIGYFDENGFIVLVDRLKDIFKYFNNHISPSELEDVIRRHPDVDNVAVIGIPDPDGGDRIPRAFVSLKNSTPNSASDILKFANGKLLIQLQIMLSAFNSLYAFFHNCSFSN